MPATLARDDALVGIVDDDDDDDDNDDDDDDDELASVTRVGVGVVLVSGASVLLVAVVADVGSLLVDGADVGSRVGSLLGANVGGAGVGSSVISESRMK